MRCLAGAPLELVQPDILRFKAFEPVLLLGRNRLKNLDIRLRVKGGGHVSQIYGTQGGGSMAMGMPETYPVSVLIHSCALPSPCSHSPGSLEGHCRFLPEV
jgi:hypothetical protein